MTRAARDYHDRTKHTWRSVRAAGVPLDWANQPVPFKLYPDLEPIPLPVHLRESDWPALDTLAGDGAPNVPPMDLARLAALLFYSAGITRRWGDDRNFRAAPSAGALYPTETYVACRDLDGLPAGLYHFEPLEFALRRLRDGDVRGTLAAAADEDDLSVAPVVVAITGVPARTVWKYGDRGYRHVLWDAGTVIANLGATADAAREDPRVVTGFVDREVSHLLGLDEEEELPVALVALGHRDPRPARPRPTPDHLPHRVVPLAPRRTSIPRLLAVHRAADLTDRRAVAAWRAAVQGAATDAGGAPSPPLVVAYETIEEVVLRRGSTRRFDRATVPAEALVWSLEVASRPSGLDAAVDGEALSRLHVVVHAVEHVQPGIYLWDPEGPQMVRPGSFRGESAAVSLEQPLGGDAAFVVFATTDLDRLLDKGGERAYRAAQIEAGIAAGRLQLAAHALGFGATGLTFYDDDVAGFLGAGEPLTEVAVGVPAYEPTPGRRPADAPAVRLQRPL